MLNRKAKELEIKIFTSTNAEDLQNKFNEWCNDYESEDYEILDLQYQDSDNCFSLMVVYRV